MSDFERDRAALLEELHDGAYRYRKLARVEIEQNQEFFDLIDLVVGRNGRRR